MKINHTRRRRKPLKHLMLSVISLIIFVGLVIFFPPSSSIALATVGELPVIYLFFPLAFLFVFSTTAYFSKSTKHGLLLALFVISALLLRLNNLNHPFFLLLLAAFFLTLELLFAYRK
jgi:hypothetical protein